MRGEDLYPLTFDPLLQYRIWGGRRLGGFMGLSLSGEGPVGEAWLLSDRTDHASLVAAGPLKGVSLTHLMASARTAMMGRLKDQFERFPLLLKFLDVRGRLSVQVHPKDAMRGVGVQDDVGKTEAWVVLWAAPGARIYAGLKPHVTRAQLTGLTSASIETSLSWFSPRVGDAVLIPAGTVHSLTDGVLVFEVQENSDVTYRLFDWDQVDPLTGRRRDLQAADALEHVDFSQDKIRPVKPTPLATSTALRQELFSTRYFDVTRIDAALPFDVGAADEPRVLVLIAGQGRIAAYRDAHVATQDGQTGVSQAVVHGAVVLLPAALGICRFTPEGPSSVLEIAIPDAA